MPVVTVAMTPVGVCPLRPVESVTVIPLSGKPAAFETVTAVDDGLVGVAGELEPPHPAAAKASSTMPSASPARDRSDRHIVRYVFAGAVSEIGAESYVTAEAAGGLADAGAASGAGALLSAACNRACASAVSDDCTIVPP